MDLITVQLPGELVSAALLDRAGDISGETAKLLALELFREDKVSLGRAAELCQTPLAAFMDYAGRHGVALHYGLEEWEQDRRNMALPGL